MGGFSLLETMVVVAVLGVLAALAVPNVLPEVRRARIDGAADATAAFLGRARTEAVTARRCVRVYPRDERTLVMERLNSFDCDSFDAADPPRIDPARGLWIEVTKLVLDSGALRVALDPAPPEQGPRPEGVAAELRFRPTGRLYSRDDDVTRDDGVVRISDRDAPAYRKVLVEAHGLVCVLDRDTEPQGTGNDLACPRS
jgi:prepilin-type N-terminal cleavage/methylation domain-containing protein